MTGRLLSTTTARSRSTRTHVERCLEDVQLVERRVRRGSALAAVFGTLGGIWLASGVGLAMAESSPCYRSCGGTELAIWSAIIGLPIAGGYGAWRSTSRLAEEVIYRRPPRQR